MARSIYDLVYRYMDMFYKKKKLSADDKKTIHRGIAKLLNDGWCEDEIISVFKSWRKASTTEVRKLFQGKRRKKENLLITKEFYFHNDLRLTAPAPKKQIDYDSGEIVTIKEPFFLEMKASYTTDDLIVYFNRQTEQPNNKLDHSRLAGSFKWLMKLYHVEEILFMIDAMINECVSGDMPIPKSPLDIRKYEANGKLLYNCKKTETYEAGGKSIVRKRRLR